MPQYVYQQVAADLRAKITDGTYPPGSRLPSRAQAQKIYGVSQIVIDKAMWILNQEGLTETLAGVGVFVKER